MKSIMLLTSIQKLVREEVALKITLKLMGTLAGMQVTKCFSYLNMKIYKTHHYRLNLSTTSKQSCKQNRCRGKAFIRQTVPTNGGEQQEIHSRFLEKT